MKSLLVFLLACNAAFSADYLTGQAARLVIGQPTFTAEITGATSTILGSPSGVAFGANTLFVADANKFGALPVNNRVLMFTPVSQFPSPTAELLNQGALNLTCPACVGAASLVLGQPDFVTTTINLTQTGMRTPSAVATDGTHLAVADTDNNRVLIWLTIPTSMNQPPDVVVGQPDFTHAATSISPTAKTLRGPQGVWLWGGKLFIADTQDNRVLIYNSIPTANGAAADVELGQADMNSVVPIPVTKFVVDATQSNIANPTSVTTDGTRLYVSDLGHNRILIYNSIPTTNNPNADVVIGQKDFVTETANANSDLCPSNGTDSTTNLPTYPGRCGKTISFPRFALSDGVRLYVADAGNDRVLVYNTIPSTNTAAADVILGEPDENSLNSIDDTNSLRTPAGLAWDGTNLYVADGFNRRVVVYTPMGNALPINAARNAASLQIYGTNTIVIAGTPAAKDTVTVTIQGKAYAYTVITNDKLAQVVNGLVALINAGTGDPYVLAVGTTSNPKILLTARKPGTDGTGTTVSTTLSSGSAITATPSSGTIDINLADASKLSPGVLVTVTGTGFADSSAAADMTQPYLPVTLAGAQLFVDGNLVPLLYASPTQINAQIPNEMQDRTSVTIWVRTQHADGSITVTNAVGAAIVPQNAGLFADPGNEPRVGYVYHNNPNATGLIAIDGIITPGDVATVTINGNAYKYTVQKSDSLQTVTNAFVELINTDPNVMATPTNTYSRIFLQARTAGTAGNGLTYSVGVVGVGTNSAGLTITAITAALCCATSPATTGRVTPDNPAIPGEVVYVLATGLGLPVNRDGSDTGQLVTGLPYAPIIPVDSIQAGGVTSQIIDATLVPGQVGMWKVTFQLGAGLPTDAATQLTIAQQLFVSNIVTFPVAIP